METIIICGTKKNSLSKTFKTFLKEIGFIVRLFSRYATPAKSGGVFTLDLSNPNTFNNALPVHNINAVIFSQDSGTAFGNFDTLTYKQIDQFLNSKIHGSVLFSHFLLKKLKTVKQKKIKLIWICGTSGLKPKNYILYHVVNASIKSFIEELNIHYFDFVEAYYLVTPFIDKTTIGILYNRTLNKKEYGENPEILLSYLEEVLNNKIKPGMVIINSSFVK